MTQEDLKNNVTTILAIEGIEDNERISNVIMEEVNQHVAEVIGEDEEQSGFGLMETPAVKEQGEIDRNRLKAEQRKRAGIGKEASDRTT